MNEKTNDENSEQVAGREQRLVSLCRVCGGDMKPSKVIVPGIYGSEDFGGDFGEIGTTMSEGPATHPPKACLKCEDCGHSFIPPKNHVTPHDAGCCAPGGGNNFHCGCKYNG